MKRLALAIAIAGIMLTLNGCVVYGPPYSSPAYAPYGGYGGYGYAYPVYGFRPRFYGGGWRGYGRR